MAVIDIAVAIDKALSDYSEEVQEKLDKCVEEAAKYGAQRLKTVSASKGWKNYSKSWGVKKDGSSRIIKSSKGQLTHLLEFGHALRQGGRTRAFTHIKPVEDEVNKKLENDVKKVIEQI